MKKLDSTQSKSPSSSLYQPLLYAVWFLTGLGLLAIYTSSSMKGAQQFGDPFLFLRKQAAVAGAGCLIMLICLRVPFRWIERSVLPLAFVTIGILALIFIPGLYVKGGGASRWINLAGFSFQPAELAKLSLVLFLAKNLSRPKSDVDHFWRGVFPNFAVFGLLAVLLMKQPDFGSTALLGAVTLLMLFVAGINKKFIFIAGSAALTGVVLAVLAAPYRMARLVSFLDPWTEIKKGGFQIIQSYLAFQNGGMFGVGLGESKQKLYFLPEAHTDFILSVIGEELGLAGVLLVCLLFFYISWVGYKITRIQQVPFRKFLAFGLTSLIAVQAAINMGVTMGLLPTKGIPLPFVSSGASSLLVFLSVAAILARLAKDVEPAQQNENHRQRRQEIEA